MMAVIPPRTVTPPNQTSLPDDVSYRHRSHLPPARARTRPSVTGYPRLPSASPEVINSLISSLDAISKDTREHFESIPDLNGAQSTLEYPLVQPPNKLDRGSATPKSAEDVGYDLNYGAFSDPRSTDLPYIDDAAEPPVVRTSKPPSGRSSLTAPRLPKKSSGGSLRNYLRPSKSSNSLHSRDKDDRKPGDSPAVETEVEGSTLGSRSSSVSRQEHKRGHRSWMITSSKERLRGSEPDKRRTTISSPVVERDEIERHVPRSATVPQIHTPSPTRPVLAETVIQEETTPPKHRLDANTTMEKESPIKAGKRKMERIEPGSPALRNSHSLIPERGSSLRHPHSHSPRNSKIEARRSSRRSSLQQQKPDSTGESANDTANREKPPPNETEEEKVTRRIRELKAQKEKRKQESGSGSTTPSPIKLRSDTTAGKSSAAQDPTIDPKMLVDPEIHERQSKLKARKMLGIPITPPLSPDIQMSSKDARSGKEVAEEDSSTSTRIVDILEPDSPGFLAEYNKALDILMGKSNPNTRPSSPKSPGHNPSRKADSVTPPARDSSRRHRHQWSQPEQSVRPPERELRNSVLNDIITVRKASMEATTLEGRRSSVDSIDLAVDDFLRAPRLSQKALDPQTGRSIMFSEVGDPKGYAVFCCVGMGLTRFVMAFYDELATTLKLRLITPDRPGIGGSEADMDREGTPLSWPGESFAKNSPRKLANKMQMTFWLYANSSESTNSPCSLTLQAPFTPSRPPSVCRNTSVGASTFWRLGSRLHRCQRSDSRPTYHLAAPCLDPNASSASSRPPSSKPPTRVSCGPPAPASPPATLPATHARAATGPGISPAQASTVVAA